MSTDLKKKTQKLESYNRPVSAHPVLRFIDSIETLCELQTPSQTLGFHLECYSSAAYFYQFAQLGKRA